MWIKTQTMTPHSDILEFFDILEFMIFCWIYLISKNIIGPDDTFQGD